MKVREVQWLQQEMRPRYRLEGLQQQLDLKRLSEFQGGEGELRAR